MFKRKKGKGGRGGRYWYTRTTEPVLIGSEKTRDVDAVLCLVNTALLSHTGNLSVSKHYDLSVKRASWGLTVTAKKRILGALLLSFEYDDSNTSSSSDIMESLCDINVLLAIDVLIRREDTADLCSLMKKYVRGKRRGTVVVTILRAVLRSVLEGI